MIYIVINRQNNEVLTRHYMPFDEKYGLGKTEEELLQDGILVEDIPEPEQISGKTPVLKYNGAELYYDYESRPLSLEEQTRQEIESLKAQNAQMLFALVEGGLL